MKARLLKTGAILSLSFLPGILLAQNPKLTLRVDQPGVTVSPRLFGLMTEEINYSYEGGIYGELIRNRSFKNDQHKPDHWQLVKSKTDSAHISLDRKDVFGTGLTNCLKLDIANDGKTAGIENDGYWGIPVRPSTTYSGSFWAMSANNSAAPFTVAIVSAGGDTTFASAVVAAPTGVWKKYTFNLTTKADVPTTANTRFVIKPGSGGTYWFTLVSLFPPTYNNRPNGNRKDIMQLLSTMNPAFLRMPGGNYLEGNKFDERFDWKNTLGPLEDRPGHQCPWGYRSSDGFGLLEYLEWCEDLHMEPLLAVFAGYTLNGDHLPAGPLLKPFVDDALEEIEYVTGDTTTTWGKQRAKDGHPAPFKLSYVEVGNEDGFDMSGSYDGRFAQFDDAIKAKYPQLHVISTVGGKDWLGQRVPFTKKKAEVVDEHYYRSAFEMESDANHYDNYDRNGPKIFVGEWATREGSPTPNFNAALGDASWMTGMLRNSDLVVMSSYAPLFVNVNPGGMQWSSDLIGYNTLNSYGSPSFYAQQMFNNFKGDKVIAIAAQNVPMQVQKLNHKDSLAKAQPKTYPSLFYVATKDSKTGTVFLNIVNADPAKRSVDIQIDGAGTISSKGKAIVMKAYNPGDTNSITDPKHIVPVVKDFKGARKSFTYTFDPYSITILEIH